MDEPTTDGAIAAATYVLQLFPYTYATTDTGPWRSLTAESCLYCAAVIRDAEEISQDRHTVRGGAITVTSSSAVELSEREWFSVDMTIAQQPSQRMDSTGTVVSDNPGGEFEVAVEMSWDDGWRVDEIGIAPVQEPGT